SVGFADASTVYLPGNVFTAELSDASGSFVAPTVIGSLVSVSGSGSIAAIIPASAATGSGYRIRVISSAPILTGADNGADISIWPTPATPAFTTNSPLCAGQTLNLSAATVAGATYTWTGASGFTSNVQHASIPSVTAA